jgi:hypothetical protein
MKKYTLIIFAVILMVFSIGFVSSSAIAAEELSVQETIDLPTTTSLFGEKTLNTSPFGEFVVGPEKNFFVLPGSVSDTPVIKFTKNGEPQKIQAIEEGQKIKEEFQSERPDDPSKIDFSSLKLNEAPEKAIASTANDITLYPYKNLVFGAGSSMSEITPIGEFVAKHYAVDSYDWKDRIRIIDVAVDASGNMYAATMEDEIRKVNPNKGLVDTWQIQRQSFDEDIPDYSSPDLVTTPEHIYALMGQTDKLLKYTHGGELVDNIKLPQREFAGSKKNRTITEILATKSGDLVALQNDLDNRILILDGNGSIKRSYKIPQSISETGRTALADIALGPDGNLYTISTTRNPASSDSEQTNLIKSADIGLDRQYNQTDNRSDNSKSSSKSSSQDESGDSNDTDTQVYWETGATSSPPDQSRAEIGTLMKLSNALQQLKVLVSIQ